MTTSNATAAVPAETDPSAEPSPPAKREGALPTVSGSGPGEWNDALLAGIVQVCAGSDRADKGAAAKARAGIAAMNGIGPGDVIADMVAAQLVSAHHAAMDCYKRAADDVEAVRWYRLGAEQGYAGAQFNLGVMYDRGKGVPEDDVEAVRWYRLAAEQGDADAQSNLGVKYANGEGVPEDDVEAVRWYRLAAEQGYAGAQLYLGFMYAQGGGVPKDAVHAYAWLSIAAAQGDTNAKEAKELVTKLMTPAQITEAQKRSREYWTRYVVPFQ